MSKSTKPRRILSFILALAFVMASAANLVPSKAAATSPGSNGFIANYGGNTINFVDPSDGTSHVWDQDTNYSASYFDVTADGQNYMTMYQRYNGTYHNSPLEVYTAQTSQATDYGFDETYYNTLSPDGSKIGYYEIDDNYMSIYDMSTSSFSKLSTPSYLQPVWSPDSTKVAFLKYDFNNTAAGAYGAYTDLKTGATYTIPSLGKPLDWSPDGTKIAFASNGGQYAISIYDVATKAVTTLNPGNKLDVSHRAINFVWSPDMQDVAFTVCDSSTDVCQVNIGAIGGSTFVTTSAANGYSTSIKWIPDPTTNSVYRFWSPKNQHHFYTANYQEAVNVMLDYPNDIWTYEGIAYKASPAGQCATGETAVYRFWSEKNSSHFFTINPAEKQYISDNYPTNVWRYEGEAFCASSTARSGYIPVYRFWSEKLSGHFFTTNAAEKDYLIAHYPTNVWRYEGVAYYVSSN